MNDGREKTRNTKPTPFLSWAWRYIFLLFFSSQNKDVRSPAEEGTTKKFPSSFLLVTDVCIHVSAGNIRAGGGERERERGRTRNGKEKKMRKVSLFYFWFCSILTLLTSSRIFYLFLPFLSITLPSPYFHLHFIFTIISLRQLLTFPFISSIFTNLITKHEFDSK